MKTVLITGANKGIGHEVARQLAAKGFHVFVGARNGVTVQLAAALPKFAVNSVCPGWVRTEMGGENASRSVEEGGDDCVAR
jgi:NAD(P)-dependent dehydrogenase (short-subunit alcohol dehydrogenase family)